MRALFKQEDPTVLIVRDADWNEASLVVKYLESIKNGATLEAKAAYNGNQEVNGIVFTATAKEVKPDTGLFIKVKATVTNATEYLPVFRIQLAPESDSYLPFSLDEDKWAGFKAVLEGLGAEDLSITPQGDIVGSNKTGAAFEGSIVVPRGLLRFVNSLDGTTNIYNDSLDIDLAEDPEIDYDNVRY